MHSTRNASISTKIKLLIATVALTVLPGVGQAQSKDPSPPAAAAVASSDTALETGLQKALGRSMDSGEAIRAYVAAGVVNKKPGVRMDYTDYYVVNKPAQLLGHDLQMIEEEYMGTYVGCCVSPGMGVTVKVAGKTDNLRAFAAQNKCHFSDDASDFAGVMKRLKLTPQAGTYATISCRERDLENPDVSEADAKAKAEKAQKLAALPPSALQYVTVGSVVTLKGEVVKGSTPDAAIAFKPAKPIKLVDKDKPAGTPAIQVHDGQVLEEISLSLGRPGYLKMEVGMKGEYKALVMCPASECWVQDFRSTEVASATPTPAPTAAPIPAAAPAPRPVQQAPQQQIAAVDRVAVYANNLASQLERSGMPVCAIVASNLRTLGNSDLPDRVRLLQVEATFNRVPDICLR